MSKAKLKKLQLTTKPYNFKEKIEDVDWERVHSLEHRAPRNVRCKKGNWHKEPGCWMYIDFNGNVKFNESHFVGLGYVTKDVAAVYRSNGTTSWELQWERRFLHTAQLTQTEHQKL